MLFLSSLLIVEHDQLRGTLRYVVLALEPLATSLRFAWLHIVLVLHVARACLHLICTY